LSATERDAVPSPAPAVAPYYPPPSYAPPSQPAAAATDGKAVAAAIFAIAGLVLALPLGLPGLIAGPIAYFLGKSARERIAASKGAIGGAGAANTGRILGVVTTAVGAVVTLAWFVFILNALNNAYPPSS
jgi:hypothetical protein